MFGGDGGGDKWAISNTYKKNKNIEFVCINYKKLNFGAFTKWMSSYFYKWFVWFESDSMLLCKWNN